jgi:hypothetical protein
MSSSTNDVFNEASSLPEKNTCTVCPAKESRLKVCCWYPVAWFRLENVASVESTAPDELRTCTCNVSNAEVVVVSAVSICSQKLNEAAVALAGMVTCCITVSVVLVPQPSIQASNVPVCGGSDVELLIMLSGLCVEVSTHGAGLAAPFSKPGLPISSVTVPVPFDTVTVTVADVPTLPAASNDFETIVCDALVNVVVFQAKESDVAFVLLATTLPSIRSCIWVTPTLSEAVAVTVTVPETVAPLAGAVTEVVGGVVSMVDVVTFSAKSSSTKEVCSDASSWPTKLIWMVWPLKEVRSNDFC